MTEVRTRVQPVPAEATFALRQRVLRPHQTVAQMALGGDDSPQTLHLAALDEAGAVVGTVRIEPAPCPWFPEREPSWQLRAMAVDPLLQGRGIGAELVDAAVQHVAGAGGGLLWCNARVRAEAFYARAGFRATDARWDDAQIGPHVGMVREVAAA